MRTEPNNRQKNSNQETYQHIYNQIHASEELKERLLNMENQSKILFAQKQNTMSSTAATGKKWRRLTWKAAAAAAVILAAVPTGVYAAGHYFGISEFFSQYSHGLSKDAGQLIETNIEQTPQQPQAGQAGHMQSLPVTFQVQEALCDSGQVNIVVDAKAAESGRYLLVPDWCVDPEIDSVQDLNIQGNSQEDMPIAKYAQTKNQEILFVNTGFSPDSPYSPTNCSYACITLPDGTLRMFLSADRAASDTSLNITMSHIIRLPSENQADTGLIKTSTTFSLEDKSSSKKASYQAQGTVEGASATITNVSMEQTQLHTYIDLTYTDANAQNEAYDLSFQVKDSQTGSYWQLEGGLGIEPLADGTFHTRLVFENKELPQQCQLELNSISEKKRYGEITLTRIE